METTKNTSKPTPETVDPWVPVVADALMHSWFPNGHIGMTNPDLAEDYENWLENAQTDAETAVAAIRRATQLS
jgi:broad specificity phosphatase PhoE